MMRKFDPRWLRRRLKRVRVHSRSDGSFGIEAQWLEPYVIIPKEPSAFGDRDLPPGLFTRMATAEEIERLINSALKIEGVK
jgi:hypothetical protein